MTKFQQFHLIFVGSLNEIKEQLFYDHIKAYDMISSNCYQFDWVNN